MADPEIFVDLNKSAPKQSSSGDDEIFKDLPKEEQKQEAAPQPLPQRSGWEIALGINVPPMTEAQKQAYQDVKNRPWGSGWAPFAEQSGAAVTDAMAKVLPPEGAAAVGGVTNFALNAVPLLSGGSPEKVSPTVANVVRNATIKEARGAGYVIPPSATGGGTLSKAVESVGGKAAVGQEASIRNQQVTNALARKAAGLADDEPLTEAALKAARNRLAEPYREISSISARAKQALEKLSDKRLDAKDAWKLYNTQGGSANRKAAEAADSVVDALERVIEKEATAAGTAGLVERLRAARAAIAKNFDVERALNIGTGDVDAHAIGRMLDKRGSAAMSGELGLIGKFAQAFGQFSREAPAGQSAPGVSKLGPYAAVALGLGGYGVGEHYGMGPLGAIAAALPMLSGPARALALSKVMQSRVPVAAATDAPRGLAALAALLTPRGEPPPALDSAGEGVLYAPPPRGAPGNRRGGGSR